MIYLWSAASSLYFLTFSLTLWQDKHTHSPRHIASMQHIRWNVRSGIVPRPSASVPPLPSFGPSDLLPKCETLIKLSPFNKLANSWVWAQDEITWSYSFLTGQVISLSQHPQFIVGSNQQWHIYLAPDAGVISVEVCVNISVLNQAIKPYLKASLNWFYICMCS